MAGLLDFLQTDDARLGIGLLAAGGPSTVPMSVGQRVAGALQGMDADKQNKLRLSLMQSQVDENVSQRALQQQKLALAQRQQAWDEQFMGGGAPAAGAMPGGMPQAGAAPVGPGGAAPTGGFNAQAISQRYGVPYEAVVSDFRFNGGKKIAELIAERSKPNWMNVNGNLVNTNEQGFQGGVQGGVAAGNDGRVTQWQPDGKGGLVVGAPRGALETYGAYQGISNRSSADFTPQEVIGPDGRKVVMPRSQVLQPRATPQGGAPANQMPDYRPALQGLPPAQPGMTSSFQGPPEQILPLIAGMKDPQERSNAYEAYSRQMTGPNAGSYAAGNVVGLSPAEEATNEANKVAAVDTAKDGVKRESALKTDVKTATKFLGMTKQIKDVFDMGPTDSGIGSAVDASAAFFGKSTKGAEAAQRLKALGGWLVANVPRMEGPQSNFDVANYQVMAADVSNDKLPLARRRAALESIETMMQGVAKGGAATNGAEGSWDSKEQPKGKVVDSLPTPNASNKGQRIRDTTTGKILVSNGLQWKEQ